jgi:hypothetical protein
MAYDGLFANYLPFLSSAVRSLVLNWNSKLSIRLVAGFAEVIEGEHFLVAAARCVPNTRFLTGPFRSELIRCAG